MNALMYLEVLNHSKFRYTFILFHAVWWVLAITVSWWFVLPSVLWDVVLLGLIRFLNKPCFIWRK